MTAAHHDADRLLAIWLASPQRAFVVTALAATVLMFAGIGVAATWRWCAEYDRRREAFDAAHALIAPVPSSACGRQMADPWEVRR